jgi:hypothetical protein
MYWHDRRIAARDSQGDKGEEVFEAGDCVPCDIRQGFPTVPAHVWSYYVSRQGGRRMFVLNLKPNQRIRINDRIDVVISGIRKGEVELGIECPSDVAADREG